MVRSLQGICVLCVTGLLLACSSTNPNLRASRMPDGSIKVEGPLAGPFRTLEDLASNACEIMTSQPGASNGSYGFEYCALNYYSPEEKAYFLSYLSDFKQKLDSTTQKTCGMPTALDDPSHQSAIIIGFDHTHSQNRKFSKPDLTAWAHWSPTRFFDQSTQRVWDRHLMLFYREPTGACSAFVLDTATRIVSALREGGWVPIGEVYNADGDIRLFEGQSWRP